MLSSLKLEANRRNAQFSTGPRTAPGKAAAARNASTHNLTSARIVLHGEDRELFDRLLHESLTDLNPVTRTQRAIVEQIAFCEWKLARIARWESEIIDAALSGRGEAPAQKLFGKSPDEALARLHRYESQIRRAWHAALRELRAIRKETPQAHEPSVAESLFMPMKTNELMQQPPIAQTNPNPRRTPPPAHPETGSL